MNEQIQVSVVLLTYEPKWEKLVRTAQSVITQQGISMEIVVGDDGSKNDLFPALEQLLRESGKPYTMHKCPRNVGTLRNILEALYCAKGEYVYLISPGDMLFDSNTLAEFYGFAKKDGAELLFGRGVYYNADEKGVEIFRGQPLMPIHPELYAPGADVTARKLSFFLDSHILGAAFLRKRETAIRYMEQVKPCAKFVEDATSTAVAMADGQEVRFFDRNVVWYEYGTGLSAPDSKWGKVVAGEITDCFEAIHSNNPADAVVDLAVYKRSCSSKGKLLAWMLLHHPVLTALELRNRRRKIAVVECTDAEEAQLRRLLREADDLTGGSHGN